MIMYIYAIGKLILIIWLSSMLLIAIYYLFVVYFAIESCNLR